MKISPRVVSMESSSVEELDEDKPVIVVHSINDLNEPAHEVDYLMDHLDDHHGLKYLVKWVGYPTEKAT